MDIKFKKVHTAKDLTISIIVIAAGAGLYFANASLGIIVGICGVLLLILYKSGNKVEGQDAVLCKTSKDLALSCRPGVMNFLSGQEEGLELRDAGNGASIRVEAYCSEQAHIAYAQLFDFSNYEYKAVTDMVELTGPRADKFISELKKLG